MVCLFLNLSEHFERGNDLKLTYQFFLPKFEVHSHFLGPEGYHLESYLLMHQSLYVLYA